MLFNSLHFAVFFPIITLSYFICPHRYRWLLLLLASCYFYMAFIPAYILILFFTITVDYIAGITIEGTQGRARKAALTASIIANVGVLAVFKYLDFLGDNAAAVAHFFGWEHQIPHHSILLPIGLSFHTFQSLSYTIEVYRGRQRAERHFGILALYVMFYPQLVAGPIERPQHLLPQFRERHHFDSHRVADGLKLMALGFLKKMVIADNLAPLVNPIYNEPTIYHGLVLLVATVCFAFQIYYDFSGYSDIALGAAQVMGFELVGNFNRPYGAATVSGFWRRWHMSLSTWFRDYLYIPLGGNRVPEWRRAVNLLTTFLVSGLWHGANWTFLVWGAIHGTYMLVSMWTTPLRQKLVAATGLDALPSVHRALQTVTVFLLVAFAWIFFRANSVADATYVVKAIAGALASFGADVATNTIVPAAFSTVGLRRILPAFAAMVLIEAARRVQPNGDDRHLLSATPAWLRWAFYYVLVGSIVFFGNHGTQQFIYFQF